MSVEVVVVSKNPIQKRHGRYFFSQRRRPQSWVQSNIFDDFHIHDFDKIQGPMSIGYNSLAHAFFLQ